MLIEILKAIIFGIIEGICEWLPISSTGHLILLEELISLEISNNAELNLQFRSMFEVVIQLGAILAVIVLYFDKLNPLKRNDNEYAFLLSKRKPMENAIKIFENFPGYIIINEHGVGHKSMVGIIQDALFLFPSKGSAIWDICAGDCLAREYGGGYYTTKGEEYPYDPEKPYLMDCCYFTPSKYKAEKFAEVFNTCGVQFP